MSHIKQPTVEQINQAQEFVVPADWPDDKVFTMDMILEIDRVAKIIMMKDVTIQ
jgi:hypothetical protein